MIIQFNDELFRISHLTEEDDLNDFSVPKGYGLEFYLKRVAKAEEVAGFARTYLIRSVCTGQLVAYFTLKAGLITVRRGFFKGFDNFSGIELSNFAVNNNYQLVNEAIPKLGSYIFYTFILPIVNVISESVGAGYLYIFALPSDRLMTHYETMGFIKPSIKFERFVNRHIKPFYDRYCRFMYQKIEV